MEDSVNYFWRNSGSEKLGFGAWLYPWTHASLAFCAFATIGPIVYDIKILCVCVLLLLFWWGFFSLFLFGFFETGFLYVTGSSWLWTCFVDQTDLNSEIYLLLPPKACTATPGSCFSFFKPGILELYVDKPVCPLEKRSPDSWMLGFKAWTGPGMLVYRFNPSTWEIEADVSLWG